MEIQEVAIQVTAAVDNLSQNSTSLLNFVSTDIDNDYKNMLEVADKYNEDAKFVDELVADFSATSEELLASINNMLSAIDGVAIAANESAEGTTEIAGRVSEVNLMSNRVMEEVAKTNERTNVLKKDIEKFKL